jgi:hypothetical protein
VKDVTFAHVRACHQNAAAVVRAAMFGGETNAQRQRCESIDEAAIKTQKQLDLELEKQEQEAALDHEAQNQTETLPCRGSSDLTTSTSFWVQLLNTS